MKKLVLFIFLSIFLSAQAQTLKGGVSEEHISKGFFGSWGVISKLKNTNNPSLFKYESRDIWSLSGYSNILFLENFESGAKSQITVKDTKKDFLKFERKKEIKQTKGKIVYREIVEFNLHNNNFSGTDTFFVEKYDLKNNLLEKNQAQYQIEGTKISGRAPELD